MSTMIQDASTHKGVATRQWARETLAKLKGIADRKRRRVTDGPLIVTTAELQSEALMCELSPPLLSDEERGKGDSLNARLHRLIGGRQ